MVDKASGCKQVSHMFLEKYKTIYTSVPTPDNDMAHITNEISNIINNADCYISVTPDIINNCIAKLKRCKSDGNIGFNSNHLVHGGRRIRVLLSLLFNTMIVHGHYPSELLKSTIESIFKDNRASFSNSDNYEAFLHVCSTVLINYLIMLLLIYVAILCQQEICSMVIRISIQRCLLDDSKAFDKINYGSYFPHYCNIT